MAELMEELSCVWWWIHDWDDD